MIFLIGETAYHRLRGKPYNKGRLVRTATRQSVAAIALLGVTLAAVVFLVTSLVFSASLSVPVTAGVTALAMATWFALPLWRRLRGD